MPKGGDESVMIGPYCSEHWLCLKCAIDRVGQKCNSKLVFLSQAC